MQPDLPIEEITHDQGDDIRNRRAVNRLNTQPENNLHHALGHYHRGAGVKLELSPLLIEIFKDGIARFGPRELSPNIIRRLEEAHALDVRAPGFPAEMQDDEPEMPGYEVVPGSRQR